MKSFVLEVDGEIMRYEVEYAKVDIYKLTTKKNGEKEFKFQSTTTPESLLKYFKHNADVIYIWDYNYTSVTQCFEILKEAKEYV